MGHGDGEGEAARLEAARRQAAFILDPNLARCSGHLGRGGNLDERRINLAQGTDMSVVRHGQ